MVTRSEKNKNIQEEIEEEKLHEKRKKIVKFFLKFTFILVIVFFCFYFYAKYSPTLCLIVKEERIINEKIPNSFNGTKIIHFSDLNYGSTIYENEIKNLVKVINTRKPDLVVFTGNLINKDYKISTKEQEKIITLLKQIDSSIGKYAVMGKNDEREVFSMIMNQSDFIILDNNYDLIYQDNTPILITGASSYVNGNRDIDNTFKYFKEETHNSNIYTISIMSETEDLDSIITNYNPDLVLAGNSLNGEIRLPLIGGIISQEGSSKYVDEYYKVNNTKIYISSGLSSPNVGFRIFNNPSINLFRLSNKK